MKRVTVITDNRGPGEINDICWNCGRQGELLGGLTYVCHICDVRWLDRIEPYDQKTADANAELEAKDWDTAPVDHATEYRPCP